MLQERGAIVVAFDGINAGDEVAEVGEDGAILRRLALQPGDRAGPDHDCFDVELLGQLTLPLLAQVGRAEHGHPVGRPAIQQLARDQRRLDGLAHAHVVGDQQAHGRLPERHDQRHELVGPRPDRQMAQRAKRRRAVAQEQPRRFQQQPHRRMILDVLGRRQRELGRLDALVGGLVAPSGRPAA